MTDEQNKLLRGVVREAINSVLKHPFALLSEREQCLRVALAALDTIDELAASAAPAQEPQFDGGRSLPFERDELGRMVRQAWVRWAQTQPNPKPSWLMPYDELSEPDKEADRQIGEFVSRWTLIADAARHCDACTVTSAAPVVPDAKEDA